jgi:CubicO group peptidase (beta-lactamase class C family)
VAGVGAGVVERAMALADLAGLGPVGVFVGGESVFGWGDLDRPSFVASVRKSVLSVAFGRLVADGRLDLDATLADHDIDDITPLTATERSATVRHLLQARSGVCLPAASETVEMQRDRPPRGAFAPGERFFYNNWDCNVLGAVFERVSGLSVAEGVAAWIAAPTGMAFRAGDGRVITEPVSRHGAHHFVFTVRDLARIGTLVAARGRWRSQELVPATWIDEMLTPWTPSARTLSYGDRYPAVDLGCGYLWWIHHGDLLGGHRVALALGYSGDLLAVVPSLDLVLVHRGYGHAPHRLVWPLLGMMIDACSPGATQPTALTGLAVRTRQRHRVVDAARWPDGMEVTADDGAITVTAPPGWVVARPLAADGELVRLVHEWGWRRRIMTVARRPDFATRIDAAAGGSTEVDEVTVADGSYGPHHGRLVERRRRSDLPVVGRTLFVPAPTPRSPSPAPPWAPTWQRSKTTSPMQNPSPPPSS